MTDKSYICDVYVYSISNGELVERIGKLYRSDSVHKTGRLYLGGVNNIMLTGVQLEPGVLWGDKYVWFYKPNKRTAAKVFQGSILEKIKDYSTRINNRWAVYDTLSSYIK